MKELTIDMGSLLALKKLNRDTVAESIGMARSNLIAALKGRRPLPNQYKPLVANILQLDKIYAFKRDYLHALTLSNAEKQYSECYNVLYTFLHAPIEQVAILDVVDDKNSSLAYVLKDVRGAYVVLRDDEKILSYLDTHNIPKGKESEDLKKLFLYEDYPKKREISFREFEKIMKEEASIAELELYISENQKIWTWNRLQKEAEQKGISPRDIAHQLKLS